MNTSRFSTSRWLAFAVACLVLSACGGGYAGVMTKKLRAALGRDFRGYQAFSYPTDNYGLVTAYSPTGRRVTNLDFICDMWNCLGINQVPDSMAKQMAMAGYASVGEGGTVTLSETEKREVAANFVLPEIYKVVGVSTEGSAANTTTTTMQIGAAYVRNLRRPEFSRYLAGLDTDHPLKQAFQRGNLALVVSDVVIEDFAVEIQANQQLRAALDAKLNPGVASTIFSGGKVGVKMTSDRNGKYTFQVTKPVIALRLIKRQPGAGVLGVAEDWSDWSTVSAQMPDTTARSR